MSELSDEDLCLQPAYYSTQVFQTLYDRHSGPLFRFIYRFTENRQSAEEILHDVFLQLLSGKFRSGPESNLKSWLYTLAKNKCLNHLKKSANEFAHQVLNESEHSKLDLESDSISHNNIIRLAHVAKTLPDDIIARTKNRDGNVEKFQSSKELLNDGLKIVILTNKITSSGAELFVASLMENKKVKIVGESTLGKWNAQIVEKLPNKFAIKYTVREFQSSQGHSYKEKGIRPDLEVMGSQAVDVRELRLKHDLSKRLDLDPQLKAAFELIKSI